MINQIKGLTSTSGLGGEGAFICLYGGILLKGRWCQGKGRSSVNRKDAHIEMLVRKGENLLRLVFVHSREEVYAPYNTVSAAVASFTGNASTTKLDRQSAHLQGSLAKPFLYNRIALVFSLPLRCSLEGTRKKDTLRHSGQVRLMSF